MRRLPIPECFYYAGSPVLYSSVEPSSDLNFANFISGQEDFFNHYGKRSKKKKILVLTTGAFLPYESYESFLKSWMNVGFKICLSQEKVLKELTLKELKNEDELFTLNIDYDARGSEKIELLTYSTLTNLIHDCKPGDPSYLEENQMLFSDYVRHAKLMSEVYAQKSIQVVLDGYDDSSPYLEKFKKHGWGSTFKFSDEDQQVSNALEKMCTALVFNPHLISWPEYLPKHFQRIKCVDFQILKGLLELKPQVKEITFLNHAAYFPDEGNSAPEDFLSKFPSTTWSALQELRLTSIQITDNTLHSILQTASNLKVLRLAHLLKFNWKNLLPMLETGVCTALSSLQELQIKGAGGLKDEDTFIKILTLAATLKIFALSSVYLEDKFFRDFPKLPALEEFSFAKGVITTHHIMEMLPKVSGLRVLKLTSCYINTSPQMQGNPPNLGGEPIPLEELDFTGTRATDLKFILQFVEKIPKLRILKLASSKNMPLDVWFNLESKPNALTFLEELDLSKTKVKTTHCVAVLKKCIHLKVLNLAHCCDVGGSDPFNLKDGIALTALQELDLTSTKITTPALIEILTKVPNLRILKLAYCQDINWNDVMSPIKSFSFNPLRSLRSLTIAGSNITTEDLLALCDKAPNLNLLDISYSGKINWARFIDQTGKKSETIKNLRSIILSHQDKYDAPKPFLISREQLKQLKIIAPLLEVNDSDYPCWEYEDDPLKPTNTDLVGPDIILRPPDQDSKRFDSNSGLNSSLDSKDSKEPTPCAPSFNPSNFLGHKPEDHKNWQFEATNNTYSQKMICGKLVQYLMITRHKQREEWKPIILNGICDVLSHFFVKKNKEDWEKFLEKMKAWNGKQESLNQDPTLKRYFDELLILFKNIRINKKSTSYFIGSAFLPLMRALSDHGHAILMNAWHVVAIKCAFHYGYLLYDPNASTGSLWEPHLDAVQLKINQALGVKNLRIGCVGQPVIQDEKIEIDSTDEFLKEGGLIQLRKCNNPEVALGTLLKNPSSVAIDALDLGLRIRDNTGLPAWIVGLTGDNEKLKQYTYNLLIHYCSHSQDWNSRLTESLNATDEKSRFILINARDYLKKQLPTASTVEPLISLLDEKINKLSPMPNSVGLFKITPSNDPKEEKESPSSPSVSVIESLPQISFKLWGKRIPKEQDLFTFVRNRLREQPQDYHKTLLELESQKTLEQMILCLLQTAYQSQRPVFYADTLQDLTCLPHQFSCDDKGMVTIRENTYSGQFFYFLKHHKNDTPLLLINYDRLTDEERVALNSLLDGTQEISGIQLPKRMQIIGVIHNNQKNKRKHMDSDFYSRFQTWLQPTYPIDSKLIVSLPEWPVEQKLSDDQVIPLFNDPYRWRTALRGSFYFSGKGLAFRQGALAQATQPLVLDNPPKKDLRFRVFLLQLQYTHEFRDDGEQIHRLPDSFRLYQRTGYKQEVSFSTGEFKEIAPSFSVINSSLLPKFIKNYHIDEKDGTCSEAPGWLEQHSKETLSLLLTHPLDQHELAELLQTAQRYEVTLQLYKTYEQGNSIPLSTRVHVWVHSDVNFALFALQQNEKIPKDVIVVDVTEMNPTGMETRMTLKGRSLTHIHLKENPGWLATLLEKKNKTVVLKGSFSQRLVEQLAPLLIEAKANTNNSPLVLIADDAEFLNFVKHEGLNKENEEKQIFQSGPLLSSHQDFLPLTLHGFDEKGGNGAYDFKNALHFSKQFDDKRLSEVDKFFQHSPYVSLIGLTGVGKSSFIDIYCKEKQCQRFDEMDHIKEWLESKEGGVLVIDEFNLVPTEWMLFDGFFQEQLGLVVDGKYYSVTANHQVIFMGNSPHYENRHSARLFETRGSCALQFEILPPLYVYERILKPILKGIDEGQIKIIATTLLQIYERLVSQSKSKNQLPVTPREIGMIAMALRTTPSKEWPNENNLKQWVVDVAQSFLPTLSTPTHQLTFENLSDSPLKINDFIVTESHKQTLHLLKWHLQVRTFKQKPEANQFLQVSGLGGLVLEGEPGIGKTELIEHYLKANGFVRGNENQPISQEKVPTTYYEMHANTTLPNARILLNKTLHEGAVLVMHEFNSLGPLLEKELNAALMGKDSSGNYAKYPGFMLIGTQNPPNLGGRSKLSEAISHRLSLVPLRNYDKREMQLILQEKGLTNKEASCLVAKFIEDREAGEKTGQHPLPTFRDLLNAAESFKNQSREKFKKFKEKYRETYYAEFFKLPGSTMRSMLSNGKITTFPEVEKYAEDHPGTRTAKILRKSKF